MLKNVKCARCVKCGKEYEATPNLTNCSCGGILDIIYDYDYIKKNLTKETLKFRPNTMWRYRELLPVEETTPDTPLVACWRTSSAKAPRDWGWSRARNTPPFNPITVANRIRSSMSSTGPCHQTAMARPRPERELSTASAEVS